MREKNEKKVVITGGILFIIGSIMLLSGYIYYGLNLNAQQLQIGYYIANMSMLPLVIGIIVLIIGFFIKENNYIPEKISKRICPNCGREVIFDAVICPYCAYKFKD